jgi:ubiquinone/menaquinone biosynthesis C-methylase UbiE
MTFEAKIQVDKKHYNFLKYNRKEPWLNFWYQVKFVLGKKPKTVLEIGPGNKTVTDILRKENIQVTTVDIDESLKPDYVASVDKLPFENDMFDLVLCSEVLEHLPYDRFSKSLEELRRVTKKEVVLCLPNAGGVFLLSFKLPVIKKITIFFKLPFFWKKHVFNGEHYWETGKKDYQLSRIKKDIQSVGFRINENKIYHDDPAHCFFLMSK